MFIFFWNYRLTQKKSHKDKSQCLAKVQQVAYFVNVILLNTLRRSNHSIFLGRKILTFCLFKTLNFIVKSICSNYVFYWRSLQNRVVSFKIRKKYVCIFLVILPIIRLRIRNEPIIRFWENTNLKNCSYNLYKECLDLKKVKAKFQRRTVTKRSIQFI